MKNKSIQRIFTGVILLLLAITPAFAQTADSLSVYLQLAAGNNPQIQSDFALYKASLEKVPQAGAFADPELEIGFFLKPMEILGGKQVADFTLMQMFPWFGTRKAARNEATEMARMAYEKFRDSRNNLYYEVRSQWYQLCNLNEQAKNTQENINLLVQLEQLALNRFAAPSARGTTSPAYAPSVTPSAPATPSGNGSGMSGMGGMRVAQNATPSQSSVGSSAGSNGMTSMGSSAMGGGNASGGMSDVLRIQLERAELENTLSTLKSTRKAAEARFNTLLNRQLDTPVSVADSLEPLSFHVDDAAHIDSITTRNPMLTMLEAEANAYRAKAVMDKKMSLPMFGIGLQYALIGKTPETAMGAMSDMNGKDMFMPMLKISLPIFRRKYNAQQRESQHYWRSSELKYENTLNQLQAEYINTRQELDNALRSIELYKKQQALSHSAWQLMVREFSAGTASLTDVIQVERQIRDYGLKKSEAIAAYNTTVAGIQKLISISINE